MLPSDFVHGLEAIVELVKILFAQLPQHRHEPLATLYVMLPVFSPTSSSHLDSYHPAILRVIYSLQLTRLHQLIHHSCDRTGLQIQLAGESSRLTVRRYSNCPMVMSMS